MANWASGASEGLTQGINNAINIMAAKRAQEDQAYQDKIRQQTAAEYEFNNTPVASVDDIVNTFNVSTPEAKDRIKTYIKSASGNQTSFSRNQLLKLRDIYKSDGMFKKGIAAAEYDGFNNMLKSADEKGKAGVQSMMEASPWYKEHAAMVATENELKAKRGREASEEQRKAEKHPYELKEIQADINYKNAKAKERPSGDWRTAREILAYRKQDFNERKQAETNIMNMADDTRRELIEIINNTTGKKNRETYIRALGKLRGHVDHDISAIRRGEEPSSLREFNRWMSDPTGYQPLPAGSNVPFFGISRGKTNATLTPQEQNLFSQNGASGKYAGIDDRNNVGVPGQLTTQVFYDQSSGKYFTPRKKETTQPKKAYGEIEWRAMGDAARKEASKNGTPIVKKRPENIPGNLSEMLDYIKR